MVQVWRKIFKFFLNLEKQHTLLNQVRTPLYCEKEVTDKNKINQELECFYKTLFTEKSKFQKEDINAYLSQINIPILTEKLSQTCEGPITESELLNALKNWRLISLVNADTKFISKVLAWRLKKVFLL